MPGSFGLAPPGIGQGAHYTIDGWYIAIAQQNAFSVSVVNRLQYQGRFHALVVGEKAELRHLSPKDRGGADWLLCITLLF